MEVYTSVHLLEKDGAGVSVQTGGDTITAGHVILAAGAWTAGFLPDASRRALTVTRQTVHWFAPPGPMADFQPARMPAFIWDDLYGFPIALDGGGVKISTEVLDARTEPNDVRAVDKADTDLVIGRVRGAFPQLGAYLRGMTCLYTSTPGSRFWIAPHPEIENVTVVSACSGHGFKHAAAIGESVVGEILKKPAGEIPASWRVASRG
jgi:sarcosine oxidase